MRAFSTSLVAYFAAVSATVIQLAESAAIPRSSQEQYSAPDAATAASTTQSDPHVVVYHDGGRPRWGFVIPNQKRAVNQVSTIFL